MVVKKHLPKMWREHFSESGTSKGKGCAGRAALARLGNTEGVQCGYSNECE